MSKSSNDLPIVRWAAAAIGFIYIYAAIGYLPYSAAVGLFIAGMFSLCFVIYPARRGSEKGRVTVFDALWILVVWGCAGYFILEYESMARRAGAPTDLEIWIGIASIIFSLEISRRT
ncbi:MAG: hypothetical protein GEU78_19560, partial [Actinobacteria bacterium]|nr:hypothetical protein [Actinomycetota bacterium]